MDEAERRTAAAVSGLRAENSVLCANFEELEGLYTRLQATAEETRRQLAEERRERAALFEEYMHEKQLLQSRMQEREEEVAKIRAEGLQKSDFQQLQLRIREELEAPYVENIRTLEATAEATRVEKERVAREHASEKTLLSSTIAELRQSLASLSEQRNTDVAVLGARLKAVEEQREALAEENTALARAGTDTDVLRTSNRQLSTEVEALRAEASRTRAELEEAGLVADKRVARLKAEHAEAAHEYDTVLRQSKFLQSELRVTTDANAALQRDLGHAESKIVALEAKASEASRSLLRLNGTEMQRFNDAEKAWDEERRALTAKIDEREQALATSSSKYRASLEEAALESSRRLREVEKVHADTTRGFESKCAELKARVSSLEVAADDTAKHFMTRLQEATHDIIAARGDATRASADASALQKEVSRVKEELAAAEGRIRVARDEATLARDSLHAERGERADEKLRTESALGKLGAEVAMEREARSLANNTLDACREKLRLERALRAKDRKEFRAELTRQRRQRRQLKETTKAALDELVSAVDIHRISVTEERKREKMFAEIDSVRRRQAQYLSPTAA